MYSYLRFGRESEGFAAGPSGGNASPSPSTFIAPPTKLLSSPNVAHTEGPGDIPCPLAGRGGCSGTRPCSGSHDPCFTAKRGWPCDGRRRVLLQHPHRRSDGSVRGPQSPRALRKRRPAAPIPPASQVQGGLVSEHRTNRTSHSPIRFTVILSVNCFG